MSLSRIEANRIKVKIISNLIAYLTEMLIKPLDLDPPISIMAEDEGIHGDDSEYEAQSPRPILVNKDGRYIAVSTDENIPEWMIVPEGEIVSAVFDLSDKIPDVDPEKSFVVFTHGFNGKSQDFHGWKIKSKELRYSLDPTDWKGADGPYNFITLVDSDKWSGANYSIWFEIHATAKAWAEALWDVPEEMGGRYLASEMEF